MAGPGDEQRMAATFQNVYTADGLQVPWFVTGGPPDWEGNITGACPAAWGVCATVARSPSSPHPHGAAPIG